jgi:hypothetical protein
VPWLPSGHNWVEKYPNHFVAKWLGHSPMIAATHSLQTREHHFEDVVSGGWEENFDGTKKSVQMWVQSKAAATSSGSHEVPQRSRKHALLLNAANHRSPLQTTRMGDEGLEPPTPSV